MNKKASQNFWQNYLSTLIFLWFAYYIYTNSRFHINFTWGNVSLAFADFSMEIIQVFQALLLWYVILLIPHYLKYGEDSKARIVLGYFKKVIHWDNSYTEKERVAFLAWLVKLFFIPLMITWLTNHVFNLINNW